ncbi:unnamed protein product [Tenebrio molitor]|nr:unnamed protein product [Tenebrio molitor]
MMHFLSKILSSSDISDCCEKVGEIRSSIVRSRSRLIVK